MIMADRLKQLTSFGPRDLSLILADTGYTGCTFESAEFLGLTNGGDFCYKVIYPDESGTGTAVGKVFVKYNLGVVTADF